MPKYLGRAKIDYDGKTLDTANGASLDIGGVTRKAVEGAYTIGHTEALKASVLECEVNVSADTPVAEIKDITGATVTFRTDIGQTWVVKNGFVTETLKMTADEKGGAMKVTINGDPAEQV